MTTTIIFDNTSSCAKKKFNVISVVNENATPLHLGTDPNCTVECTSEDDQLEKQRAAGSRFPISQ